MAEGFIVAGLDGERGVVRSCVEEGGFSKVKEDCLLAISISTDYASTGSYELEVDGIVLLFECKKPPIIWTCGGDRQRISSREASWLTAIRMAFPEYFLSVETGSRCFLSVFL